MMERILKLLDREEPDYDEVSRLGSDAVPFLLERKSQTCSSGSLCFQSHSK